MQFWLQQFGKWLVIIGVFIAFTGGLIIISSHLGLFRLPGDLEISSKNWRFFFPIASCIVISILLTGVLWLINYFIR